MLPKQALAFALGGVFVLLQASANSYCPKKKTAQTDKLERCRTTAPAVPLVSQLCHRRLGRDHPHVRLERHLPIRSTRCQGRKPPPRARSVVPRLCRRQHPEQGDVRARRYARVATRLEPISLRAAPRGAVVWNNYIVLLCTLVLSRCFRETLPFLGNQPRRPGPARQKLYTWLHTRLLHFARRGRSWVVRADHKARRHPVLDCVVPDRIFPARRRRFLLGCWIGRG